MELSGLLGLSLAAAVIKSNIMKGDFMDTFTPKVSLLAASARSSMVRAKKGDNLRLIKQETLGLS